MKLALDIHHDGQAALAAAVAFDDWAAPEATRSYTTRIAQLPKAVRGELDLRDLPCFLQLLQAHALQPELIVINGWVHLDALEAPGLGRHLYHALGSRTAIIGVSRTSKPDTPAQFQIIREEETRPLTITCVGIDLGAAKARLRMMHGRRRIPTLLKLVTRIAKGAAA